MAKKKLKSKGGRGPSKKNKTSKVKKLIRLAKSRSTGKSKKGRYYRKKARRG